MSETTISVKNAGYYDINTQTEKYEPIWDLDELFYIRNLQQRKLFLNASISQVEVDDIIKHIMQINAEDRGKPVEDRKPILLYLSSNGGYVDVGFQLIDVILESKTPVYTINLGYQYSMGFLIGIAGHKRFATKNAKFLNHDGFNVLFDSGAKVQDYAEFQKEVSQRMKQYVLSRTKITEKEYDDKYRVEWYMFADEAKRKGIVDYIIGEDAELDDIV